MAKKNPYEGMTGTLVARTMLLVPNAYTEEFIIATVRKNCPSASRFSLIALQVQRSRLKKAGSLLQKPRHAPGWFYGMGKKKHEALIASIQRRLK